MYAIESNGVRYEAKTINGVIELFNAHKDLEVYRERESERIQAAIDRVGVIQTSGAFHIVLPIDVAEKQRGPCETEHR